MDTAYTNRDYKPLLGQHIRALRESQGVSLRKFALMIGMDHTYLVDIELGRRNVTVDTLAKIAAGLDVELSELFSF